MDKSGLKDILSSVFDFEQWKNILIEMFPKVEFFTRINQVTHNLVKDGGQAGTIRLDDGRSLAIYVFEVNDNVLIDRNRKGLREITAKAIDQSIIHGVLAFYYSKNVPDYRLTFIAKQSSFNENGELVKSETAPKRYTFLLGENEPCRTAAERLYELISKRKSSSIYLADVTEAFSVERLNKEFFAGYKAQYTRFLKQLDDSKQNRDYVKKLLGRLVFLQFLQKKGWMGVPASRSDWEGGDKNYLSHLIEHYEGNNRLLSDVLEPLFFDTLNNGERKNDVADKRLGNNIKIPYLNGGLFDKDKIDELNIDFPYSYFKDLMDFFAMYNFTIDENDPDDSEVGIDPEMLGHIFENLLEDNKDKGAFYTPKEIVQYMCRQSVIQYLKTHETEEQYAESIEQLINNGIVMPNLQTKNVASRFMLLLKEVKVCDPAIGSGAFPMGILYVLYHAIHHLQSHAEPNKSFDSTRTKREIIQNNIFGVDIEQGAVDIARLRFWLALVVDAEEPQPLPNLDYKITCGNSLLSRYPIDAPIENVFVEYNKGKKDNEKMTLIKYKELVREYTDTSNHQTKEFFRKTIEDIKGAFKTELSKQFKDSLTKLKSKIIMLEVPTLFGNRTKEEKAELKKLKEQLALKEELQTNILNNKLYINAFEWRFEFPQLLDKNGNFTGFDIVIGNPPYVFARDSQNKGLTEDIKSYYYKTYKLAKYQLNLYHIFIEKATNLLTDNGIFSYIIPNNWLTINTNKVLREYILNMSNIKIINFYKRIFETADVDSSIVIFSKSDKNKQISLYEAQSKNDIKLIKHTNCSVFLKATDSVINIELLKNDTALNILNKIENQSNTLKTWATVKAGLQAYEIGKGSPICTKEMKNNRIYHSMKKMDNTYYRYLQGSDVCRYHLNWSGEYLKYGENLAAPRKFILFSTPRILVRQIPSKPPYCINACFTDEIILNDRNSMNIINMSKSPYYLLGILNSKLISFWFIHKFGKMQRGLFPQFKINELEIFPIANSNNNQESQLALLVSKQIGGSDNVDNAIDKFIYKLYNLTYDEVLIVDPQIQITREEYEKI